MAKTYKLVRIDFLSSGLTLVPIPIFEVNEMPDPIIPLKIGDVVSLRSGPILMTIEGFKGADSQWASCVWFVDAKLYREDILITSLEKH